LRNARIDGEGVSDDQHGIAVGAAREKASVAMTVPPPGRFSIDDRNPAVAADLPPRIRAQISAVPPAGNGLTS